jgi:hypothetical protein
MLGDVPSRLVKYSWVTPDYILGTQMDHPHAVYNHLAIAGRWQGLVTGSPGVRIATVSLDPAPGANRDGKAYSLEHVYHSVQHRNVLITQQKKRWTQINPDWFPAYDSRYYERPFGIYIGGEWDSVMERDGWIFTEKDGVFAAIRILLAEVDPDPLAWAKGSDRYRHQVVLSNDSYEWNHDRTILRFRNKFSPAIIEAGSKRDYGSFDRFMEKIANNPVQVFTTIVTRETGFILAYKGCGEGAEEIVFNAANPDDPATVAGRPIDYTYGKVFDCPYMESEYDSAAVYLRAGAYETELDFNDPDFV